MHRRKRERAKALLKEDPKMDTDVVCERSGCHPATVKQVKKELEQESKRK